MEVMDHVPSYSMKSKLSICWHLKWIGQKIFGGVWTALLSNNSKPRKSQFTMAIHVSTTVSLSDLHTPFTPHLESTLLSPWRESKLPSSLCIQLSLKSQADEWFSQSGVDVALHGPETYGIKYKCYALFSPPVYSGKARIESHNF